MNARENALRVYRHERAERLPVSADFCNFAFPCERSMQGDDGYDWFGVHWVANPGAGQMVVQDKGPMLESISDWREIVKFPDFSSFDFAADAAAATAAWDRENQVGRMILHNGNFERLHALMRFEDSLVAFYEDPEALHEFYDAMTEYKIQCILCAKQYYNPDVIIYHDDWGTNRNMFFSPELWRDFFKEDVRKLCRVTQENGMFFELHCCGHMMPVIGELVEDIGIDALQPLQYPQNDIRLVKEKWGSRLVINGGYDGQKLCSGEADEGEKRRCVRECVEILAPGGNHIPSIPPIGLDFDEVIALLEDEAKRYEAERGRMA